jgi:hypothetical protein
MSEHTCVPKLLFSKSQAASAIGYQARALDCAAIASGELPVIRHGNRVPLQHWQPQGETRARTDYPLLNPTNNSPSLPGCATWGLKAKPPRSKRLNDNEATFVEEGRQHSAAANA